MDRLFLKFLLYGAMLFITMHLVSFFLDSISSYWGDVNQIFRNNERRVEVAPATLYYLMHLLFFLLFSFIYFGILRKGALCKIIKNSDNCKLFGNNLSRFSVLWPSLVFEFSPQWLRFALPGRVWVLMLQVINLLSCLIIFFISKSVPENPSLYGAHVFMYPYGVYENDMSCQLTNLCAVNGSWYLSIVDEEACSLVLFGIIAASAIAMLLPFVFVLGIRNFIIRLILSKRIGYLWYPGSKIKVPDSLEFWRWNSIDYFSVKCAADSSPMVHLPAIKRGLVSVCSVVALILTGHSISGVDELILSIFNSGSRVSESLSSQPSGLEFSLYLLAASFMFSVIILYLWADSWIRKSVDYFLLKRDIENL